ncbi:hypothetical protein PC123_g19392 [Phytophthora cactorum]|nr:hypothetical protein PC120_g12963 [Phytophthora cactorum]KAG4045205.1 hypothetical protein PC123_g19392 [Phytophthora cactorum]
MLITGKDKAIIASVKAGIAEKFKIKDLGRARFIIGVKIDYDITCRTLRISQKAMQSRSSSNSGKRTRSRASFHWKLECTLRRPTNPRLRPTRPK